MEESIKNLLEKQLFMANLMNYKLAFIYLQGYTSALVHTKQISEQEANETMLKLTPNSL